MKKIHKYMFALLIAVVLVIGVADGAFATVYVSNPRNPGTDARISDPTTLLSINEDGSGLSTIGNVTITTDNVTKEVAIISIAMDAVGTLYGFEYVHGSGSRLVEIDSNDASTTVVGNGTFVPGQLNGAAFDRNGNLWVLVFDNVSRNGVLRGFDISTLSLTGNAVDIPEKASVSGGDIAFDLAGTCWFIGTYKNGDSRANTNTPLYTYDFNTATFSLYRTSCRHDCLVAV